ncbi:DUF1918 domain-containing protein [Amnibacterium sp.]|uniref:DUF1918 domain-containing protein n=1 Tax=Amnibacterium sp. TaxID=1872496 RepID=UPI003F7CB9BC
MHAQVDDEIVVQSHHLDEQPRRGRILEVHGPGGTEPFLVRWDDSGHTALVFPGADASVVHLTHRE